jgi:hypothetical protein
VKLFGYIDSAILYEGENAYLRLVEAVEKGKSLVGLPNLIFRDDKGIHARPIAIMVINHQFTILGKMFQRADFKIAIIVRVKVVKEFFLKDKKTAAEIFSMALLKKFPNWIKNCLRVNM